MPYIKVAIQVDLREIGYATVLFEDNTKVKYTIDAYRELLHDNQIDVDKADLLSNANMTADDLNKLTATENTELDSLDQEEAINSDSYQMSGFSALVLVVALVSLTIMFAVHPHYAVVIELISVVAMFLLVRELS